MSNVCVRRMGCQSTARRGLQTEGVIRRTNTRREVTRCVREECPRAPPHKINGEARVLRATNACAAEWHPIQRKCGGSTPNQLSAADWHPNQRIARAVDWHPIQRKMGGKRRATTRTHADVQSLALRVRWIGTQSSARRLAGAPRSASRMYSNPTTCACGGLAPNPARGGGLAYNQM